MTDLNATILALQIDQGVRFVEVEFFRDTTGDERCGPAGWSGKTSYIYKVEPAIFAGLKIGSLVVAQARSHLQVVRVVAMDVNVDFGNLNFIKLLRWVVADITSSIERVSLLVAAEVNAKKQSTNARLRKESQDLLAAANLTGESILLLPPKVAAEHKD